MKLTLLKNPRVLYSVSFGETNGVASNVHHIPNRYTAISICAELAFMFSDREITDSARWKVSKNKPYISWTNGRNYISITRYVEHFTTKG